ncbi:MAG: phage late control D family protein, partial [Chloroflexales bacterium]|nr:phage late control D family protein [Chloroflexales bacterium]
MPNETLTITLDDAEQPDLYEDMLSVEVELDDELAAMFRLKLSMPQAADGSWRYLDDERLQVWRPVSISAGIGDGGEELIGGVITHLRPVFEPDAERCTLEVWGMDRSVLMGRADRLKAWPNKKDSDIAREIIESYGLSAEVDDSGFTYDEAITTIMQRETDIQFLQRLALRNGFECFVEGETCYFRLPRLGKPPQPTLAAHFGDETSLERFSLEVNALAPAAVAMEQIERNGVAILEAQAEAGEQEPLGASGAASLLGDGVEPAILRLSRVVSGGLPAMESLVRSLSAEGDWFVEGEGEARSDVYGHVLRPRRTVTIKGVGERHSGIYYVRHVTHRFTPGSYTQHFQVKRNALMPRGDEPFAGDGGLLGG